MPPTTEPLPVPIRSPSPPNTESALLVARIVSGEAIRVAPNAKALIVAVPVLPDRLIRSPLPATAPGLKLKPPAPPVTVLPAAALVLPLSAVVPPAPTLISMPPAAPSMLVVPLPAVIVSPVAPITALAARRRVAGQVDQVVGAGRDDDVLGAAGQRR